MANTNNSITNWLFHLKNGIANRNPKKQTKQNSPYKGKNKRLFKLK